MPVDDISSRLCLVTGATGFVGGWLTERLTERGARVRCLVRSTSRRQYLPTNGVELAVGDVTDVESLRRAMDGVEYVFHVAGLITARRPSDYYRVNADGTRNVASVAAEFQNSLRRVLVVSSLAAAGPSRPGNPVDESQTPRPVSPYGKSKLLAEAFARAHCGRVPVTIVRPPSVYGPRDRETLLIFRLAGLPVRPSIVPHGEISAIHVADLVDGIILATTHPSANGQTYFLSGDETPSMSELLELIARSLGQKGRALPVPGVVVRSAGLIADVIRNATGLPLIFDRWKAEEIAIGCWSCSSALARAQLGFQTSRTLAEGIQSTAEWYRSSGWL
jgi:nucleoside-diphosphate-sugar epimerase